MRKNFHDRAHVEITGSHANQIAALAEQLARHSPVASMVLTSILEHAREVLPTNPEYVHLEPVYEEEPDYEYEPLHEADIFPDPLYPEAEFTVHDLSPADLTAPAVFVVRHPGGACSLRGDYLDALLLTLCEGEIETLNPAAVH